jgi:hypothetical protein
VKCLVEFVVGATAIDKGRFGLTLRAGNKSTRVARRIEDEGTGTRKHYGLGLKMRCGAVSTSARRLVHISLHTERSGGSEILLRVPCKAVTRISREPAVEVIAVA